MRRPDIEGDWAGNSNQTQTLLRQSPGSRRDMERLVKQEAHLHSLGWRQLPWFAALVAASIVLSLGFACAVPLAAFAAIAALTMNRRAAVLLVLAIVLANQGIGLGVLHYPATGLVWGAAFALVGVTGVFAAEWTYRSMAMARPAISYAAAFVAAFVVYEGGLFLITIAAAPEDLATYATPVVVRITAINAAAFVGLLAAARITVGLFGGSAGLRQRSV
jgi:hypothetical protein